MQNVNIKMQNDNAKFKMTEEQKKFSREAIRSFLLSIVARPAFLIISNVLIFGELGYSHVNFAKIADTPSWLINFQLGIANIILPLLLCWYGIRAYRHTAQIYERGAWLALVGLIYPIYIFVGTTVVLILAWIVGPW